MSRRQRQRAELRDLCSCGRVTRAVDLAFEHFADVGREEDIVDLIADTIDHIGAPESVRRRFAELQVRYR